MTPVTEVVLFQLKETITDADFLKEAAVTQAWVEQQEGYISRELLKTEDGQWIDTVRWTALEHAENAAAEMMQTEHCMPFMSMIDETQMQMWHFQAQAIPVN